MNSNTKLYQNTKWIVLGIVAITAIFVFKDPISEFINRANEFEGAVAKDGSVSFKIRAAVAISQLESKNSGELLSEEEINEIVTESEKTEVTNLSEKKILWVDNNPENVRYEIQTFKQLGLSVTQVTDGTEALKVLREGNVSVVISDFKRENDPRYGGYGLFDEMKDSGVQVPYIFYSAKTKPESRR